MKLPPRIHIVGRKNHGKTGFVVDMVKELSRRGLTVGTVKHTPHAYEADSPGSDSYTHKHAGANPVAFVTGPNTALYLEHGEADPYEQIAVHFSQCDLLLVEGDAATEHPKVEIWRSEVGGLLLAEEVQSILAVISDDNVDVDIPVWSRSDIASTAERFLKLAGITK